VNEISTHQRIDPRFSGAPVELGSGSARVVLQTSAELLADERGLVHGGFVFSLADFAAMLAINHPNVVLGSAQVRFLKPVVAGESIEALAELERREGKKHVVKVRVTRGVDVVLEGELVCFVPERHVLDSKIERP
jgi:uncharacterized protein (TIGR00369 family)